MQNSTPLPLRNDTILGVCEAIGRDFGFNPLWLRLAFIAPLFFAPYATFFAYLGLGMVVGATHLLVKDGKPSATVEPLPVAQAEQETLAIAA